MARVRKLDVRQASVAACLRRGLARRQRDRVGLVTFAEDVQEIVPPSARHLPNVLHALERATAGGSGALARPLAKVAQSQPRRGIFVLLSDLYEPAADVLRALGPMTGAGHDVIVIQVLDAAERTFPFEDATTFRDLESGARLPVSPGKMRERYIAAMDAHVAAMRAKLGGGRVDYSLVSTAQPLDRVLFDVLTRREFLRTAV
ncbi:MAG: vWA domain-containing protein [Gemmatimonadaceae bacterium]|nr:vWA domain-containing protein [Gemmatimonadaceae bacterium]